MKNEMRQKKTGYSKTHRRGTRWKTGSACLAIMLTLCLIISMSFPAVTMGMDTGTPAEGSVIQNSQNTPQGKDGDIALLNEKETGQTSAEEKKTSEASSEEKETGKVSSEEKETGEAPVRRKKPAKPPVRRRKETGEASSEEKETAKLPARKKKPAKPPVRRRRPAKPPVKRKRPPKLPVKKRRPVRHPVRKRPAAKKLRPQTRVRSHPLST